jgi:hypothetical protein
MKLSKAVLELSQSEDSSINDVVTNHIFQEKPGSKLYRIRIFKYGQ